MASVRAEQRTVGQVGKVYELRHTKSSNQANIDFSVAVTPRVRNEDGTWGDGDTTWHNFKAWGRLAENAEKSLKSGQRVIVDGYWSLRKAYSYTNEAGETVEVPARNQLTAERIGIDIEFDPAHSERKGKSEGGSYQKSESSAPKAKAPASKAKAPAPKATDSFDDLDDLDLDSESPF